jgi:hypothetical protein
MINHAGGRAGARPPASGPSAGALGGKTRRNSASSTKRAAFYRPVRHFSPRRRSRGVASALFPVTKALSGRPNPTRSGRPNPTRSGRPHPALRGRPNTPQPVLAPQLGRQPRSVATTPGRSNLRRAVRIEPRLHPPHMIPDPALSLLLVVLEPLQLALQRLLDGLHLVHGARQRMIGSNCLGPPLCKLLIAVHPNTVHRCQHWRHPRQATVPDRERPGCPALTPGTNQKSRIVLPRGGCWRDRLASRSRRIGGVLAPSRCPFRAIRRPWQAGRVRP